MRSSSLYNNRTNQINPILDWVMFHKVYHMYCDIKNIEEFGSTNKPTFYQLQDTPTNESTSVNMIIVTSDLYDVKPQQSHVWNCNEFGFDPNGR